MEMKPIVLKEISTDGRNIDPVVSQPRMMFVVGRPSEVTRHGWSPTASTMSRPIHGCSFMKKRNTRDGRFIKLVCRCESPLEYFRRKVGNRETAHIRSVARLQVPKAYRNP